MGKPRPSLSPHLGMILVVLCWGLNFTATKSALPAIPPLAFAAVRFTVGSGLMLWLLWRQEGVALPPAGMVRPVILLGLLGNTVYQLCFMLGLARTTVTNSSLLLQAMPPTVTVASHLLGHERVGRARLAALGLAMSGVLVVMTARGITWQEGGLAGDLLILASVLCWTAYTLGVRSVAGRMSPLALTAWTTFTGTPGLVLAGLGQVAGLHWSTVPAVAWGGLAYSTIFSLGVAYVLYIRALERLGPARTVLYTCVTPLVASGVAIVALGERPTGWHILGATLIVSGVLLAQRPAEREGPFVPEG
jgi:drug/metabolite transporter (DMT)-like permease